MCGRFNRYSPVEELARIFHLSSVPELEPQYNIAPTQPAAVVRTKADSKEKHLVILRWGLIPSWAKDREIGGKMINARSETAHAKPAFRSAILKRRCVVPANGFYEWQKIPEGKIPHNIMMKSNKPFGMAGLWEQWKGQEGDVVESFTILTTTANDLLRPFHDRMPVILDPKDYDQWLDPRVDKLELLTPLLRPFPSHEIIAYPVAALVNNPKNRNSDCITPLK